MAEMSSDKIYVFELKDLAGGTPFGRTTDSGIAAFIFTNPANALNYATAKGHGDNWIVRELNVFDARDWLLSARDINNVTSVWSDPAAKEEGHREIPVALFLAILSKACEHEI